MLDTDHLGLWFKIEPQKSRFHLDFTIMLYPVSTPISSLQFLYEVTVLQYLTC